MTKKIFRTSLLVGLAALALSAALFCWALARHFAGQVYEELAVEAELAAQGVALGGRTYLEAADFPNRFTWIASDGAVLFDSSAQPQDMANHLARPEIQDALAGGRGRASRLSDTLSVRTLYVALALEDGTVLRVSSRQPSAGALLAGLAPEAALILLVTVLLSGLLAGRLARRIIRPILELDAAHPEDCETYEELTPLLRRLRAQQETIRAQTDELRRRQEEFTAITENMSEGFLLVDRRLGLLSFNTSALRLLGAPGAEAGQSVLALSRAEGFRRAVEEALSGGHGEALLEREGVCCQVLASCVRHRGRAAGAVVALLDVTERARREALRREFTANVSHELKTPLTSISGFAELMKDGLVPQETVPEFASDIYREAQRLIALVEDVIHLSQLDENAVPADRRRVDLYALAGEVLARLAPAAARADVTLSLEGEPAEVEGVPHVLEEMIANLVDNAIKYNRPGGSAVVTVGRPDGRARLTVRDTGIGIPPAHQPRVFERFYRVDKSHSREVGGTGLGLSIVKHAAAYHGAALELESREGIGTAVTVRWRQEPPENRLVQIQCPQNRCVKSG